jgi:hypothetical protein
LDGLYNKTFNVQQVQDTWITIIANQTCGGNNGICGASGGNAHMFNGTIAENAKPSALVLALMVEPPTTQSDKVGYKDASGITGFMNWSGSTTIDTAFMVNYTLPQNYGVNWINMTSIINSTLRKRFDSYYIYMWNSTTDTADVVITNSTTLPTTSWNVVTYNMTSLNNTINDYLTTINTTQQSFYVWFAQRGGARDDIAVDLSYIQVGYKIAYTPAVSCDSGATYTGAGTSDWCPICQNTISTPQNLAGRQIFITGDGVFKVDADIFGWTGVSVMGNCAIVEGNGILRE